jgi:predicted metal-binding protein
MTQPLPQIECLVCTSCRRGLALPEGEERPGSVLRRRLAAMTLEGVRVTGVECLSNCDHGCTIALRGAGRWTYVYGRLDETADLAAIGDGIARYRSTTDGLVPWRERPEHFRKNCIARIPPLETA